MDHQIAKLFGVDDMVPINIIDNTKFINIFIFFKYTLPDIYSDIFSKYIIARGYQIIDDLMDYIKENTTDYDYLINKTQIFYKGNNLIIEFLPKHMQINILLHKIPYSLSSHANQLNTNLGFIFAIIDSVIEVRFGKSTTLVEIHNIVKLECVYGIDLAPKIYYLLENYLDKNNAQLY